MALDEADKKLIADLIAGALSPESLAKAVAPVVEAHTKAALKGAVTAEGLQKQLDEALAKLKPTEGDDKPADKGGKADPAVAALEKKLAAMEAASKVKDAELAAQVQRARTERLHASTRDALAKAGIPADRLGLALASIKDAGVLDYDGDRPGWRGKSALGLDEVLAMEDGAAAWVKGEGKLFLPPSGASGTGDGNGGRHNGRGNGPEIKSLGELSGTLGQAFANL